jgi:hypothetical protein
MGRSAFYFFGFTVSCLAIVACGGNVAVGTGAGGTGATGTGATGTGATGTGAGTPTGDCKTDADCSGGTCVAITPGGYLICLHLPPEATTCSAPQPVMDQCCTSADCTGGSKCFSSGTLGQCGGPAMAIENECLADHCTTDADCEGGGADTPMICAPAGAFGFPVRTCFTAYCKVSGDCTEKANGVCAPVDQQCCSIPAGLGCVYPGGCATDSDCAAGDTCQLDFTTGNGVCGSGPVGCPD